LWNFLFKRKEGEGAGLEIITNGENRYLFLLMEKKKEGEGTRRKGKNRVVPERIWSV